MWRQTGGLVIAGEGSRKAVVAALAANLGITVTKLVAALLTGSDASRERFLDEAPRNRILHVATHAFLLDRSCGDSNPLLHAGLVFAGANRSREASILTAQQIASLDLNGVDWAVLSACNTGNGELSDGEGVLVDRANDALLQNLGSAVGAVGDPCSSARAPRIARIRTPSASPSRHQQQMPCGAPRASCCWSAAPPGKAPTPGIGQDSWAQAAGNEGQVETVSHLPLQNSFQWEAGFNPRIKGRSVVMCAKPCHPYDESLGETPSGRGY